MTDLDLILRDRHGARAPVDALILRWRDGVPLTARLLIEERVRIEWERAAEAALRPDSEQARAALARRLVALNPWRRGAPAPRREPTVEDAVEIALAGFDKNAFFLLVDGAQVTRLDETIPLRPTSEVTFVRLLPLVGG
ncbi:MAG: hypothetical protein JNK46_02420 [Methylobacteriaceae bacterium]|nr:hypothetical protein [Methylobacteriaceae bacterium]